MKKKIAIIIILIFFSSSWAKVAVGAEAYLTDILVTQSKDDLLIYFKVENCFTQEMNEAIDTGINTTFTFFIKLYEKRDFLWDREISDHEINHTIKYDPLKKTYEVRRSEKGNRSEIFKSYEKAQEQMAEIVSLKVTPIKKLERDKRYQIRVMAQLDKIELPFYLEYLLFFLSLWDFETEWYGVDFKY